MSSVLFSLTASFVVISRLTLADDIETTSAAGFTIVSGSGEKSSGTNCAEDQFACADGYKCVMKGWLCDGARDCLDGSDETYTACDQHKKKDSTCLGNQPECEKAGSLRCILHEWLCDGHPDCDSGEDEYNCATMNWIHPTNNESTAFGSDAAKTSGQAVAAACNFGEFVCSNGGCIAKELACNGVRDCPDGSDEDVCQETSSITTSDVETTSEPVAAIGNVLGESIKPIASFGDNDAGPNVVPASTATEPATTEVATAVEETTTASVEETTEVVVAQTETTTVEQTSPPPVVVQEITADTIVTSPISEEISATTTTPEETTTTSTTSTTPEAMATTAEPITTTTVDGGLEFLGDSVLFAERSKTVVSPENVVPTFQPKQPLSVAPVMAILFVTPVTQPSASVSLTRRSQSQGAVAAQVVVLNSTKVRDAENPTAKGNSTLRPVRYVKGIPIEPINKNNTKDQEDA